MKAICSYAEDSLGCRGICARIAPDNTASLRLAQRLHMHLTSDGCYLVIF
ncbi:MAG: GNAT family N-acetyltransferase [Lachnospiraceae bacterium]|nr:GNAT family N-acetyltransferase [Lachnospiraceae bacterium]